MQNLRDWLEDKAQKAGFDKVAVTKADLPDLIQERLEAFLDNNYQGDMTWLAETAERRSNPKAMWPEAKSAIILACNYGPDHNPLENLDRQDSGNISVYARAKDYHDVIKGQLKQLAGQLAAKTGCQVKVFVDTAPLMEKPLAAQAGMGWQGKHTNLVSSEFGSWLFLGTILIDGELPEDIPARDQCGSCTACLDICPTNAFPAPYKLDARRCISYLTIEHKGVIDVEFRSLIGNRIFGCDDCLAICPWNKFASEAAHPKLKSKAELGLADLSDLLQLDETRFRKRFAGTPVRRAGHSRFLRNVLIAAGNSGASNLLVDIVPLFTSPEPLVRGMAIWAASRLDPDGKWQSAFDSVAETDKHVLLEWEMAQTAPYNQT